MNDGAAAFSSTALLLRKRRAIWFVLAGTPVYLGVMFEVVDACRGRGTLDPVGLTADILISATLCAAVVFANPWPTSQPVRVAVDDGRLRIDERGIPLSRIRKALVLPLAPDRIVVRIWTRGALSLDLVAPELVIARTMLRSLRWEGRTLRFRTSNDSVASVVETLGIAAGLLFAVYTVVRGVSSSHALLFGGAVIVWIISRVMLLAPLIASIEIGSQSVELRAPGRARTIPLSSIESAQVYSDVRARARVAGVQISLTSGEIVRVLVGRAGLFSGHAHAIVERLQEAIDSGVRARARDAY